MNHILLQGWSLQIPTLSQRISLLAHSWHILRKAERHLLPNLHAQTASTVKVRDLG